MYPIYYSEEDLKTLESFYYSNLESYGETGWICHEKTSKHVHSDVMIFGTPGEDYIFASFGMGAKPMISPPELDASRCELIAMCHVPDDSDTAIILQEIVRLTKFPFENSTWLWAGHTVLPSEEFVGRFGCHAFILIPCLTDKLALNCGNVSFYALAPLYKDEYDRIVTTNGGSFEFIKRYYDEIDEDEIFTINTNRKHILI